MKAFSHGTLRRSAVPMLAFLLLVAPAECAAEPFAHRTTSRTMGDISTLSFRPEPHFRRAGLPKSCFRWFPGPLPEIVGCHLGIAPLCLQIAGAFQRVEHHVIALMAGVFVQPIARLQLEWIT